MLKLRLRSFMRNLSGKMNYSRQRLLEESLEEGYQIIRQETANLYINEVCYSMVNNEQKVAQLRGFYNGMGGFHLHRVENLNGDGSGNKSIPKILSALEKDLKKEGITHMTTLALFKLAPIEVRRHGFYSLTGKTYQDLKNSRFKNFPWLATLLRKDLV